MVELLDWTFKQGGAVGVVILVLVAAVVYLHRRRERDARAWRREQRKNLRFLLKLVSMLRNTAQRTEFPSHPYERSEGEPDPEEEGFEDWEEPTVVTQRKQETTRERIQQYVDEYLNGNGKDRS